MDPIPGGWLNKGKRSRAGVAQEPRPFTIYLSCKVAILFAAIIVYRGSPSGATVMPNGSLPLTTLPSVMTPSSVIWAMFSLVVWVNQIGPSGDAAIPSGPGPYTLSVKGP